MPTEITNQGILDLMASALIATDEIVEKMQAREKMNKGLLELFNQEYGEYGWDGFNMRDKTVVLRQEALETNYNIKNPISAPEKIIPDDIEVTTTGQDIMAQDADMQPSVAEIKDQEIIDLIPTEGTI